MIDHRASQEGTARCHRVHRDQGGAMALMSLAAILIIIMMGMVLYDVAGLGVDKTHLQTSTDSSAYSQATIQARSMNMISFSNVGKRMTVGMANTYISMYQWLKNIEHLVAYSDTDDLFYTSSWFDSADAICDNIASATGFEPDLDEICTEIVDEILLSISGDPDTAAAAELRRAEGIRERDAYYYDDITFPDDIPENEEQVQKQLFEKSYGGLELASVNPGGTPNRYHRIKEWAAPIGARQDLTLRVTGLNSCVMDGGVAEAGAHEGEDRPVACVTDIWEQWHPGPLINQFYGRDLLAFDNYQRYLRDLTPYWAWMEGIRRGLANSAPITVGYPRPDFGQGGRVAHIPITRGEWADTCQASQGVSRGIHSPLGRDIVDQADIEDVIEESISDFNIAAGPPGKTSSEVRALTMAAYGTMMFDNLQESDNPVHQILPRDWEFLCLDITEELFENADTTGWNTKWGKGVDNTFRHYGRPMMVNEYEDSERADWLMASSNLMFGFRPNASRFGDGLDKFFVGHEPDDGVEGWGNPIYDDVEGSEAGGIWSMARSEIAYQGSGAPSTWSPEWAARMRPVSLPGEWEQLDGTSTPSSEFEIMDAWVDVAEVVESVTEYAREQNDDQNYLIPQPHKEPGTTEGDEYLNAEKEAIEAMMNGLGTANEGDIRMEGLSK